MSDYNFSAIEKKWQKYWLENKTFKTDGNGAGEKFYCLDMFPWEPPSVTVLKVLCSSQYFCHFFSMAEKL